MINSRGFQIPRKVIKITNNFLAANEEISWIGSKDPNEWPEIYFEYKKTRKDFLAMLESLYLMEFVK